MFYNTDNESGEELKRSRGNAWKQDEIILELFQKNPLNSYTPFEVMGILQMTHVPITSIRRAMNSLTRDGLIEKTQEQRLGEYGKLNYCWKLIQSY